MPRFQEFLRYCVVGGIATVVDFGIYSFLWRQLDPIFPTYNYLIANTVGFITGVTTCYLLSIVWVFSSRKYHSAGFEFIVFALVGVVGLLFSQLGLWILIGILNVQRDIAKAIVTCLVLLWNYSARKWLLFRKGQHEHLS